MFGVSGTELFIILVFVLLIFGPDKLPAFGRTIGQMMREFKRAQATMEQVIKAEIYASDGKTAAEAAKEARANASKLAGDEGDEDEDEDTDEEPATPEEAGGWTPGAEADREDEADVSDSADEADVSDSEGATVDVADTDDDEEDAEAR